MPTSPNPYRPMLVTFQPETFFGRADQITSILRVITAPAPSGHAIYGIRSIGKTTLLRFLKDEGGALKRYEEYVPAAFRPGGGGKLLFVPVNFHKFTGDDESIFHAMLFVLSDELSDLGLPHVQTIPALADRMDITHVLRQMLDHLAESEGIRVVYLLDDFDEPLARDLVDEEDDYLLRALSDHAALIIVTEDPIARIRPDIGESSPLLGILHPDNIGLLKDGEARDLITVPAQTAGISYTQREIDFLLATGGRQPFTLTAACELYFDMRAEFPDISQMLDDEAASPNLTEQFVTRLAGLPHMVNVLEMTWEKLSEAERMALRRIADGKPPATNGGSTITSQLANKSLVYLDLRQGSYHLFSRVLAHFIHEKSVAPIPPARKANEDGDLAKIAQSLPNIDREVLRYLSDRRGQVCTFEELLEAVWADEADKSKRALEAAVYRLRREIGDLGQIKNVRGRGYKFTS